MRHTDWKGRRQTTDNMIRYVERTKESTIKGIRNNK